MENLRGLFVEAGEFAEGTSPRKIEISVIKRIFDKINCNFFAYLKFDANANSIKTQVLNYMLNCLEATH